MGWVRVVKWIKKGRNTCAQRIIGIFSSERPVTSGINGSILIQESLKNTEIPVSTSENILFFFLL